MAVDLERRDAVLVITLNRPEARNALDGETIAGVAKGLDEAENDPGIGAVVLTGAGDKAFCAGMDLKAFASGQGGADPAAMERYLAFTRGEYPKPIIAAVNGTAVAGGFELMFACDMAVAAEHAVFGIPEVKRGLMAAGGGVLLPLRIPLAVALEMGLTGDPVDAARAYQLGLVNRVVPADKVMEEALALAARIAENGPLAVAVTKRLMRENAMLGGAEAWDRLRAATPQVFGSEDAMEGATAFAEKRKPQWKGR